MVVSYCDFEAGRSRYLFKLVLNSDRGHESGFKGMLRLRGEEETQWNRLELTILDLVYQNSLTALLIQ